MRIPKHLKNSVLNCSFCEKTQAEVKKLIAGPRVYICNECVDICNEILLEEVSEETQPRCSFCLKAQPEVKKLLAGVEGYICAECVDICNEVISDTEKGEI